MLQTLAHTLAAQSVPRRLLLAAMAGALAVLALPPLHLIPVLAVSFPVLLWLLDGAQSRRTAFLTGWAFGLGFFMAGLYWIANALLIDAARFGWMIPFAVGGLSAVLAVYHGLGTLALYHLRLRGWGKVLAFAGLWGLLELLRGWLFTGFPWNPIATVWMPLEAMTQATAWIGAGGLGLVTVAVFAMPTVLGWRDAGGGRAVGAAVVALGILFLAGVSRLPADFEAVDGVRLRLVQPSIPQGEKWSPDQRMENLHRHLDLSLTPGEAPPTAILWGETALPFALPGGRTEVGTFLAERLADAGMPNTLLLTGAVRLEHDPYRVFNSLVALNYSGAVIDFFDKVHLVPFGEYVPFRSVLSLEKITSGSTDFTPGPGLRTLTLPGLPPFGPLVCYEIIFSGSVTNPQNRPQWLLNITNDGWYGVSSGPYQHLATSRLRAIEEGLPLVRVANTGLSVVTDPHGRIIAKLDLNEVGAVDSPLPEALPPTVFSRFGTLLPAWLAALVLAVGVVFGRNRLSAE